MKQTTGDQIVALLFLLVGIIGGIWMTLPYEPPLEAGVFFALAFSASALLSLKHLTRAVRERVGDYWGETA